MAGSGDMSSLKYDPFLTRVGAPGSQQSVDTNPGGYGSGGLPEEQPLMDGPPERKGRGGEAKLMILPTACCMMISSIVSVVALAMSFSETGHKDGYEEGHLDSNQRSSGCEAAFYWLMVQAGLDLLITCCTCLFIVSPLKAEPVGMQGCAATVRLCTLAAGFHILYFSGLKRELCDPFLIIWSTILVWLGFVLMVIAACFLICILLGATGGGHPQYRQQRRQPVVMKAPAGAYQTMVAQPQGR
jgi:hypothetical protein